MLLTSTRDFKANQIKFLDIANNGEDIILRSRGKGSFKLIPIKEEALDKRDTMTGLKGVLQQVKEHLEGKRKLKTIAFLLLYDKAEASNIKMNVVVETIKDLRIIIFKNVI